MPRMHVYLNVNGGSPKMWVYSDSSGPSHIAWGSCFKGGHQKATKHGNYGRHTANEKLVNGYDDCGQYDFSSSFGEEADALWNDLRTVLKGSAVSTPPDRAFVLQQVLATGQQSQAKRNVTSSVQPAAPTPPPEAPKKPVTITSVLKDGAKASASHYDW